MYYDYLYSTEQSTAVRSHQLQLTIKHHTGHSNIHIAFCFPIHYLDLHTAHVHIGHFGIVFSLLTHLSLYIASD